MRLWGWRFLYPPLALLLPFFFFSFFPYFLLLGEGKLPKKDCSLSAFNLHQVHVKWCCVEEGFAWLKCEVAVKANKLSVCVQNSSKSTQ